MNIQRTPANGNGNGGNNGNNRHDDISASDSRQLTGSAYHSPPTPSGNQCPTARIPPEQSPEHASHVSGAERVLEERVIGLSPRQYSATRGATVLSWLRPSHLLIGGLALATAFGLYSRILTTPPLNEQGPVVKLVEKMYTVEGIKEYIATHPDAAIPVTETGLHIVRKGRVYPSEKLEKEVMGFTEEMITSGKARGDPSFARQRDELLYGAFESLTPGERLRFSGRAASAVASDGLSAVAGHVDGLLGNEGSDDNGDDGIGVPLSSEHRERLRDDLSRTLLSPDEYDLHGGANGGGRYGR